MKDNKRHAMLSVGCPYRVIGHAGFKVEDGKFICDCGYDFTKEVKELAEGIEQSLKNSYEK